MLGLKTDLVLDAACTPNLSLEIATSSKTSVIMTGFASWKVWGKPMRNYGIMPEFRYWFSGRTYNRWFVGVGALAAAYDIEHHGKTYQGDTYGGGLTFGYDFWLGKHWALDVHAGVSVNYYEHSRTPIGIDATLDPYDRHGVTVMPYQLGVSLVYIIK